MCSTMTQLKDAETFNREECNRSSDQHLQMYFGQCCLEAARMTRFHYELCAECKAQGWPEELRAVA